MLELQALQLKPESVEPALDSSFCQGGAGRALPSLQFIQLLQQPREKGISPRINKVPKVDATTSESSQNTNQAIVFPNQPSLTLSLLKSP